MAVTFSHAHMFRCMTVAEKYMASGSLGPRFPCVLMSCCLYKGTNTCITIRLLFRYLHTINVNGNIILQWQYTYACGIMEHIRRAGYKKSFKAQELNNKGMFLSFFLSSFLPFIVALQPYSGLGRLIVEVSRSYTDTPHSVRLYWTSDQPVSETCA
jgi:hypothetical protein